MKDTLFFSYLQIIRAAGAKKTADCMHFLQISTKKAEPDCSNAMRGFAIQRRHFLLILNICALWAQCSSAHALLPALLLLLAAKVQRIFEICKFYKQNLTTTTTTTAEQSEQIVRSKAKVRTTTQTGEGINETTNLTNLTCGVFDKETLAGRLFEPRI